MTSAHLILPFSNLNQQETGQDPPFRNIITRWTKEYILCSSWCFCFIGADDKQREKNRKQAATKKERYNHSRRFYYKIISFIATLNNSNSSHNTAANLAITAKNYFCGPKESSL